MKIELTSTEEIVDGEEITIWHINKGEGNKLISINELFDDGISECWIDKNNNLIEVLYYTWDNRELFAFINTDGVILRGSIHSVDEVLDKQQLIIVEMDGFGMSGEELIEFDLTPDDSKMAVINYQGKFVIPPTHANIWFDEYDNIFYGDNNTKFTIDGNRIN